MYAVERGDGVAKCGKGAADLAVAPFIHCHLPFGAAIVGEAHQAEAALSVFEVDAKFADHLLVKWLEIVIEPDIVHFCFGEFWVGHAKCKIAIVCQEEDTA